MKTLYQTPETTPSQLEEAPPYSYQNLAKVLEQFQKAGANLPPNAIAAIEAVLKAVSEGVPFTITVLEEELSTQEAADMLLCSRPYLVKLLEEGAIPYTKVGSHRRLKRKDLLTYRKKWKAYQRQLLTDMMNEDAENGLYDV